MFAVFTVPDDAAEITEQIGTKYKFWFEDEHLGRALFKEGRPNTGENWAERLAAELALVVGLPHAYYELANFRQRTGVISKSFVPDGGRLIHGNELLGGVEAAADDADTKFYRDRSHTVSRVFSYFRAVSEVRPPVDFLACPGIETAIDVFVGYLMFDAWIANQDRHNQNWGLVRGFGKDVHLAPSYDHGSSMGRNETDERRIQILTTRDSRQQMSAYVARATSGLYPPMATEKAKPLSTIDAFGYAMKQRPAAGAAWLNKLRAVTPDVIASLVDLIPGTHATEVTKEFTRQLLQHNCARLLAL
ncbi:HipA domain-containing protein [Caballeronia sp. LZ034LL]|uniref:HipA domain-containing protein n=1 Tax=Caballeronia sp. LZ034LL TaxID=3038567 RepID=UPI0028598D64|nr:HipA domain-containing protein [Caballeronia sp. LZ034LL]MDR5835226.1 HipA domain-containing protein [Caballeronia sp. LZ034LL]